MIHAGEHRLQTARTTMDYITFGTGTRPLIMIQGLNTRGIKGAAVPLALMYRLFAKDFRVYLFDRRQELPDAVTVQELAADIASAMDALEIGRADVFGVSQGGMIAQYLALDRPELVNRLVLAVTLCRNNDTVEAVIRRWIELTEKGDDRTLVADMAEKMYSDAYLRRYRLLLPLLTAWQKPRDRRRFITLASACLTCDTYDKLDQIRCPVLVIGGAKDRIVTGEASLEMARRLGCRVELYPQIGHAAYDEAGDFNRKVYDFLMDKPSE